MTELYAFADETHPEIDLQIRSLLRNRLQGLEIRDVDVLSFPHHGLSPMCIRAETMRTLNPRVILIPGGLSSEKAVKSFVIGECGVSYYPRFYSNNDGNILVISDGVTLRTAYGVKPGELPEGKPVKERR